MKNYIVILLFGLMPITMYSQGFFSTSYDMSYGLGATNSYISQPSFRGITFIDSRSFITDNISIGGSVSWHVFYKEESGSFTEGTTTITGNQYRYINAFPIMFTSHYYFGDGSTTTFYAGTGIGVVSFEKRTDMGLYTDGDAKWHFGIVPQVGVLIPISTSVDIHACLKYHQTFKAGDFGADQYLTLSLGFAWW